MLRIYCTSGGPPTSGCRSTTAIRPFGGPPPHWSGDGDPEETGEERRLAVQSESPEWAGPRCTFVVTDRRGLVTF